MAVVEVGDMIVHVLDLVVLVPVGVSPDHRSGVHMIVVLVVVCVFVLVLTRRMAMRVLVAGPQG